MDEVHFIVNQYSFPLPLASQTNPSFLKVSHLPLSQAEQIPKLFPLLLLTPLFWGYLNSQFRINKMLKSTILITILVVKINLKDTSFHNSINSLGLSSVSRVLVEFSPKLLYFTMYGVHILFVFNWTKCPQFFINNLKI